MSNTWKAKCVWVKQYESEWNIGDIIEVVNGVGVASKNYSHGFGGTEEDCLQSFDKWCEFQDEDFTKWELISEGKPTLRDHINQLSNIEFAEMIVQEKAEEKYDYNWEEDLVYDGIEYTYVTTDNQEFYYREDAINHQIKLLEGEYNG